MRAMDTGVYIRRSHEAIELVPAAEVIEAWEGGCLIRSEEKLESSPSATYYVIEADQLVAVKLSSAEAKAAPFDYAADKDRSDTRALALAGPGGD